MKKNLIKRLVKEVEMDVDSEEDHPIEYYEMQELAKTHVILKVSLQIHALIYIILNILLILGNLYYRDRNQPLNLSTFWALWVIISWGFILWAHLVIVVSINTIDRIETIIFVIISLIFLYIIVLLIYLNIYLISTQDYNVVWWPFSTIGLIFLILILWYAFSKTGDQKRFKKAISKEIDRISGSQDKKDKKNEDKNLDENKGTKEKEEKR
ncbi:MAG: 2TM domain-containing protein [Promethearchaeota archaeon]